MSARDAVAKVKRALRTGDAASWEAAEGMAELRDDYGWTQREIADDTGVAHQTVSRYLACWEQKVGSPGRQLAFSEAMEKVRGRADGADRREIPKTPEKKAALVADLLKDKKVADAPVVRKVQERHADRRLREAVKQSNRDAGIPTRTDSDRDARRSSTVVNHSYWFKLLTDINITTRGLNDATGELDRTGLPKKGSGEIIKAARTLARAAERFAEAARAAGIGEAAAR